jgi:hypothetical protein
MEAGSREVDSLPQPFSGRLKDTVVRGDEIAAFSGRAHNLADVSVMPELERA